MLCYRDKTFCRGYKNSKKCKVCDRYFNKKEYEDYGKFNGYKPPVAFFVKPLCEKGMK